MRNRDREKGAELLALLKEYDSNVRPLPGIEVDACRSSFVEQLLESIRRVKYISIICSLDLSTLRCDPTSTMFDPLKAAHIHDRIGNTEESFWLVFLSVHFGKNLRSGWTLCRDVYRGSDDQFWTWDNVQRDIRGFREWLSANQTRLKTDGIPRGFGNHRKYESLDAWTANGTGATIDSYVTWATSSHLELFNDAAEQVGRCPKRSFAYLYSSMTAVHRFGRTAKFDYLTMVGKLRLANIVPNSPYLSGATGPLKGAQLMFIADNQRVSVSVIDDWVIELGEALGVGMQEMEDALCNWQKSPDQFIAFRG